MFYLTAFLSMLIGLLIYMTDPAPTDLRREMDNRTGEAYVGAFFNQHQAAREFVKHWLGYIYPKTDVVETYGGSTNNTVQVIAIPGGKQEMADAASAVAGLEDFMPKWLSIERYTDMNNPNKGFLKKDALAGRVGSYMSALICLDGAGNLTACYSDGEYLSGDQIIKSSTVTSGYSDNNAIRLKYDANVKPYVITYKKGNEMPSWWIQKGKSPKAIRLELWRRAMARRSHSSHNCGVLYKAPESGTPVGNSETSAGGWVYKRDSRYNRVRIGVGGDGGNLPKYCLDNGQRCMNVLPNGIQQFLEYSICGSVGDGCDLNETFFCMSPVEDPYERIEASTYHFDGINFQGLGAQKGIGFSQMYWVPTVGAIDGGTQDNKLAHYELDGGTSAIAHMTGNPNNETGFGVRLIDSAKLQMPFHYSNGDFTLIFVVNIDYKTGTNTFIVGEEDPNAYFRLKRGSDSEDFVFYPNTTSAGIQLIDAAGPPATVVEGGTQIDITTRHVIGIMRQNNEMFFLIDNKYYCDAATAGVAIDWTAESAAGPGKKITFGPDNQVALLDVRYYNHALSGRKLSSLFKVDMARYGVIETEREGLCQIPSERLQHSILVAP